MPEPTADNSPAPGAAAAASLTPDPIVADLMAKHSAGERLSQSQYGKLGAFKARLQALLKGGKPGPDPGQAQPGPGAGQPAPVAPLAPAQAPDSGLAPVPVDAGLVQRTTNAILTRLESIARRSLTSAAREAGATGETLARFDRAASLPKDDRALIVELSPDVAASLGLDVRHWPLTVCLGALGLWGTDIWLAVQELKAMRQPKPTEKTADAKQETVKT